jgi:GT2 family glycosyltransferase
MGIVSALICTRGRPQSLVRAVRSLLATDRVQIELIVIDQSVDMDSQDALAPLVSDPRLRYLRSRSRGKGAALNEGLAVARGNIVVCTDDDCEAPSDWAADMADALEEQSTAAIIFCDVAAGPYVETAGYIPTYRPRCNRLFRSIGDARAGLGLGAGMAVRREIVIALGGFDETFGPGARFASGEDHDIGHRALLRGWHVYVTTDLSILHHGFLTFAQGREHTRRDWMSGGAAGAKLVRTGRFDAASVPLWIFAAYALWPPFTDVLRLRRPRKLARLGGFVQGFWKGMKTPLDRQTLLYRPVDLGES